MKPKSCAAFAASLAAACLSLSAHADVVISSEPTENMSCSGGVCSPTATNAVLNVNDLENDLASGNLEITTTGSGGIQAQNIDIDAQVSWSSASSLALDAYTSITVNSSISDAGSGGVSLTTNDGGSSGLLLFLQKASLSFSSTKDSLSINGTKYKLETSIRSLAYDIVKKPTGAFALANDIDAKHHIYRAPPIPVDFTGSLNGLGHTVAGLEIVDSSDTAVGFFATMSSPANISSIGIANVSVIGGNENSNVGGLIGYTNPSGGGTISNSWVTGDVEGEQAAGGLVGSSNGTISNSWSSARVSGQSFLGGLVGANGGTIEASFATGAVAINQSYGYGGGLIGINDPGAITNSYALGKVSGGQDKGSGTTTIGGLIGAALSGSIETTYSAGRVSSGTVEGGFIGDNSDSGATAQYCYWDKSRNKTLSGVGEGSDTGIKAVSTEKLRSGLPKGFDPAIWAQNANINHGFPYLIANPPPDK